MTALTELLNNPEVHYPGNFDTPQRANALLTGLCQDAATEIERLQDEILEQCRINGMGADREDALRAEVERLKKATPPAQPAPEIAIADAYRAGVDSGIAAEREACARVCESQPMRQDIDVREQCAAAIRARGKT